MMRLAKVWILGILAIVILAAAPPSSWAGWLGFRNDLKATVIVQSSVVTNNRRVVPGRPKALVAGEVAWDSVLLPGNRVIQVYDANNREIYRKTIPIVGDLFFSIQSDPKSGVQLVPIKATALPQGQKPK